MELTYKKTGELIDRFIKKHDSVICKRLLNGCELTTKEGQRLFRDRDLLNREVFFNLHNLKKRQYIFSNDCLYLFIC